MMKHTRNILLVVSLAGNFFLLGLLVAHQYGQQQHGPGNTRPPPDRAGALSVGQLFAAIRQLPDATRAQFKTQLEQDLPNVRAHHAKLHEARIQLHAIMVQSPFDVIAFRQQLAAVATLRAHQEAVMADAVTRFMTDLSVEERKFLLTQMPHTLQKKRKARRHGPPNNHRRPSKAHPPDQP